MNQYFYCLSKLWNGTNYCISIVFQNCEIEPITVFQLSFKIVKWNQLSYFHCLSKLWNRTDYCISIVFQNCEMEPITVFLLSFKIVKWNQFYPMKTFMFLLNFNKRIFPKFFNWEFSCTNWKKKRYFLALGMGPYFGPKLRQKWTLNYSINLRHQNGFYGNLPFDICKTFAIFFITLSILDSVFSISWPNSSNILKHIHVLEFLFKCLIYQYRLSN